MSVLRHFIVGLVWWITAWAFGIKAFDAFLLTAIMVVVAAAGTDREAVHGPGAPARTTAPRLRF